jgi:hypothetical protein
LCDRVSGFFTETPRWISIGFNNAASLVENLAIQAGETVPPEHLVKALRIVEELRTASLGRHDKPRHGV